MSGKTFTKSEARAALAQHGINIGQKFDSVSLDTFARLNLYALENEVEKPKGYHKSLPRYCFDLLQRAAQS